MKTINSQFTKIIKKYIKELKKKIRKIQKELPEFNMHEELREIQVLYRTINELKTIVKDYTIANGEPFEYDDNDPEMDKIKEWLKGYWRTV